MEEIQVPELWGSSKIPIHPECQGFVNTLGTLKGVTPEDDPNVSVADYRAAMDEMYATVRQELKYEGVITDKVIPSPDRKGGIPIQIYKPEKLPDNPVIIVHFHGGGMVVDRMTNRRNCHKRLSSLCRCLIVDVDYRYVPECKVTTCLNDCAVAAKWVLENPGEVGGTPFSPVGVAGDSAGGLCTIYTTHHVDDLDFQIPIYPWIDMANSMPSRTEFPEGPVCSLADLKWFAKHVVDSENGDAKDVRWSPLYCSRDSVVGKPPALVILAEVDPCRDDGRNYAKLLIDAGVPTEVLEVKGAVHVFFSIPEVFQKTTQEAYIKVANFLEWISQVKKTK